MNTQSSYQLAESEQTLVDAEHPWPGLASFREQDEHYFKGRELDIDNLYNLIARERLTILFGVSGLGKSSLLQAGLFPRLRPDYRLPVFIRLDFGDNAASLVEQVFAALARQFQEQAIEASARQHTETLWEYFHRKDSEFWDARNHLVIPILCFDQFEEIFTLGRETSTRAPELKDLLTQLADLVEGRCPETVKTHLNANPHDTQQFSFSRHPYKLIFSLREDYLADLEGLRTLMPSIIHNRMRLLHMNGVQALTVADQTRGRLMDTSVAESVVRLVAGEQSGKHLELSALRIEPALLSLVCRELNERRLATQAKQIDAQTVASNREQILADFYERSLSDQSDQIRWFIEDKLITLSGFRNSEAYENAVASSGITSEAMDQLVQRRLLRLEERDGVKRIELIHDVLTGVVRKSRDQRLVLEKQRRAEQERLEAEQREQATQQALKRSKRWTIVFLVLTAVAISSSAWGWWSWWDAKESRSKAQHALAMVDFREAQQHYQNNNIASALAYLAHAVRLDPNWVSSRTLLTNLLQQRNWILPLEIFKQESIPRSASFSPDGTRLMTMSPQAIHLWDLRTDKPIVTIMEKDNVFFNSVEFSPDGKKLVTASGSNPFDPDRKGYAKLWDAWTGAQLGEVMASTTRVWSAKFSPKGNYVITESDDNSFRLSDAKTGKPILDPIIRTGITSVQFSPDETQMVLTYASAAQLWDRQMKKSMGPLLKHPYKIKSVTFNRDGSKVLTISEDDTVRIWDARNGQQLSEWSPMHLGEKGTQLTLYWKKAAPGFLESTLMSGDAKFSPDGTRVTILSGKEVKLFDATSGNQLGETMAHKGYVSSLHFSPDGAQLATVSGEEVLLWSTETGKRLGEALTHKATVSFLQFSPDGKQLLTVSDTAKLWDLKTGRSSSEILRHKDIVNYAEFSGDGEKILTASADRSAQLWDVRSGKPLLEPMLHQGDVKYARFSPGYEKILTISSDNSARLWNADTGAAITEPMHVDDELYSAELNSNETRLITRSKSSVLLWNAQTSKLLFTIWKDDPSNPLNTGIISVSFSKDGRLFLIASHSYYESSGWGFIKIYNSQTGKLQGKPIQQEGELTSAQFSPHGSMLAVIFGKTVQIWDTNAGHKSIGTAMTHENPVRNVQFSRDSSRIVTLSLGGSLRLWEAKTGKPLSEPMTHEGSITAQFSFDDTRIVTVSVDNSARLWDGKTGKALGEIIMHKGNSLSAEFSPDSSRILTTAKLNSNPDDALTQSSNNLRLWDAASGKALGDEMKYQDFINSALFNSDGTRVVTASNDNTARIWDISSVNSGNIELLADLAVAVAGNKLTELDAVEPIDDQIERLQALRKKTADAPLGAANAESFTRWFLSDPWTRPISPLSQLTVPDYIQQQITAGHREQMEQEFPGHPLLRSAPPSTASKPSELPAN